MNSIDLDTLQFPQALAPAIGLSKNEIAFLKKKGCPFYGRKTSLRWVREFLARQAGAGGTPPCPSSILDRPHALAEGAR